MPAPESLAANALAFDDHGPRRPGPALLLIHGHPFDRSLWARQAAAAAAHGWRAVVPDLRGYGASPPATAKTTLARFADDLVALLDVLGIERVVVCGLSMGGQIAMELVRAHADRLQGVVLAATFARADDAPARAQRLALAERLERGGARAMRAYADELLPRMFAPATLAARPDVVEGLRRAMRRAPAAGAAAALRGRAERPDYFAALGAYGGPALVVAGDEDTYTTREDAERLAAALRHGRLVWLAGVGHLPNLERPEAFDRELLAFLDACAAR